MQLTMQVHSFCGQPPADIVQRRFKHYPVIIGRSPSCDYIVHDDSKYISSNHARITQENNTLLIQDTSSNGIYINGSTEAVGRGNTTHLRHGDTVTMGDYCLRVGIGTNEQTDDPLGDNFNPESPATSPTTLKRFHTSLDPDYDWTPPSQQENADEEWDPTQPIEHGTADAQDEESDWANWDRGDSKRAAAPIPIDGATAPPSSDSHGTINTKGAVDAFLTGAGLDAKLYANLDDEQLMHDMGILANQAIEGIMLLLKSRGELKNTIRSDVTMLSRSNNNPLKFSHNAEEALSKLVTANEKQGYLSTQDAMQQAVEDLQLHQLAMLEGMKAAVTSLLSQFDPDRLANRLEQTNPIVANIPITRDAKLWHLFHDKFNGIREEALSDFNELFGAEFRKAYEKRIRAQGRTPDF